jgi:hypothetical protein
MLAHRWRLPPLQLLPRLLRLLLNRQPLHQQQPLQLVRSRQL